MTTASTLPELQFTGSFPRDPRLLVRDHATFLRESLRETMREHHERHIPRHFEPFAAAKYGYLQRSARYRARKARAGYGNVDNVLTGRTRSQVTSSRTITATQTRARLVMRLPLAGGTGRFKFQNAQGRLTDQQKQILARIEEVRAIAPDEERYLGEFLIKQYTDRANSPGVQFRVRDRLGRFAKASP